MDYKKWKLKKSELNEHLDEYAEVATWCNENGYHIEEDGQYYKTAKNPDPVPPTLEERVMALESKYDMNRWQREAILASEHLYSEYTVLRAREVEELAKQLRG